MRLPRTGLAARLAFASAALLLLASWPSVAAAASFLEADTDWPAVIGPPPAADSTKAGEDLAILLWVQRTRSQADVDRVWAAMSPAVGTFQQAVGTMLLPQAYPKLYAAVNAGLDAATPVYAGLKARWDRPRPVKVDDRVTPCTPTPNNGSYPSGTAALGMVAAQLLADLLPERREAILARGEEIGELRVVAGVHFPSDVDAGIKLGRTVAEQVLASDAWAETKKGVADETKTLRKSLRSH